MRKNYELRIVRITHEVQRGGAWGKGHGTRARSGEQGAGAGRPEKELRIRERWTGIGDWWSGIGGRGSVVGDW